ncbi:MAG: hypothetical protein AB1411_02470 [Nitrospirota bacterium]
MNRECQIADQVNVRPELITDAVACCRQIARSSHELIEQKFKLGELVCTVLKEAQHGDRAVRKLSETISKTLNKIISACSLYEAARLIQDIENSLVALKGRVCAQD